MRKWEEISERVSRGSLLYILAKLMNKRLYLQCHHAAPGVPSLVASEDKRNILPLEREASRKPVPSDSESQTRTQGYEPHVRTLAMQAKDTNLPRSVLMALESGQRLQNNKVEEKRTSGETSKAEIKRDLTHTESLICASPARCQARCIVTSWICPNIMKQTI